MLKLPAHNIVPLVQTDWQIAIRLDPLRVRRIHYRLGRRTDGNRFGKLRVAALCHPGHFRCKVSNVRLFTLERGARNKDREVALLHTELCYFRIEPVPNRLPDGKRPVAQNVTPRHVIVLDHFTLGNDLRVPVG
uniref:Uncharacterized protein n=1 Tax=Anopheles christyi TaxID=43041 RepID=A0A182KI67_9DIPT